MGRIVISVHLVLMPVTRLDSPGNPVFIFYQYRKTYSSQFLRSINFHLNNIFLMLYCMVLMVETLVLLSTGTSKINTI